MKNSTFQDFVSKYGFHHHPHQSYWLSSNLTRVPANTVRIKNCLVNPASRILTCSITGLTELSKSDMAHIVIIQGTIIIVSQDTGHGVIPDHPGIVPENGRNEIQLQQEQSSPKNRKLLLASPLHPVEQPPDNKPHFLQN